jgi:hypothetical protein
MRRPLGNPTLAGLAIAAFWKERGALNERR